ncbi:MAG: IPT/TIG domain-containing protein, partial [Solirubrobacteraceae bacterium]
TVTGTFATVNGSQLPNRQYMLSYTPTSVTATVTAIPPAVTKVEPVEGPTVGGTSVTITGTELIDATGVSFGSTAATSYTVDSATQITATAPAGSAGAVDVTVTTPGGTSTTSPSDHYTYIPEPTVTKVEPGEGPLVGGTPVTITGTNLTGAKEVKFGSVPAKGFTVSSATSITAESPVGSAGTVKVTVTTVGGESAVSSADDFTYVPAPAVTKVVPHEGPIGGSTKVTITGANLLGATAVKFGSAAAKSFTVVSGTSITAESPAGAAGTVNVVVTTVGGESALSGADDFTYVAAPTVTKVEPAEGPAAGGTKVTITGTHFTGAKEVKFGSVAAKSLTVVSGTSITAESPAGAAGTVNVTVTTVGGKSAVSSADDFTYVAAPTVTKVEPAEGPVAGGTIVTITGTNFTGAKEVKFGSVAATGVTVNTATSITAQAPAGSGTVDVTVVTVGGTSATGSADQYAYVPVPTVTKVEPGEGPTAGGTSVTITGTNLTGATGVSFGSTAATSFTVNSATQITASAPAGTGTVDVTVTTVGGTSAPNPPSDQYTFVPEPTVTSVSPTKGPTAGGTTVTITGTNFTGAKEVKFGSVAAKSFTVVSGTSITAVSPAGTGIVNVTVTTVGGESATNSADEFGYGAVAPSVSKVEPVEGPLAGGTKVTITGTNFTGAKEVKFGTVEAKSFTVVSATSIMAESPAGVSAATVNVFVKTVGGQSATVSADDFTYVAAPTVTKVAPVEGPVAGGTKVTITGTHFTGAKEVRFGSVAATSVVVVSAGSITATAPAGAAGPVDVTVTTVGGTSALSSADQYTYVPLPTVTKVEPGEGPVAGGTPVTITGTNFTGAKEVKFGSVVAKGFTVVSATSITVESPAEVSAATVNVVVTTVGGKSAVSSADDFTYVAAPTVTKVAPVEGPVAGGTKVTITGTHLTGAKEVKFGSVSATNVVVVSSTSITATAPAGTAGPVDVTVTTVGGTSATSGADHYTYIPAPSVTKVEPHEGPTTGATTVTITGTSFAGAKEVKFGSVVAKSFTVDSATSITAESPAGSAGTVNVVVTTVGGKSAVSSADDFTYVAAPTVTKVAPVEGPVAGGTKVTITGTHFTGAKEVKFGSVSATNVVVVSSTSITATAPAGATGPVNVTVTTVGGTSALSSADEYTYV